jgi:hypothetical protein
VNAGGDSGAMAGNGYEKIIAIDLLLVSFRDMPWVQRRLVVGLCNIAIPARMK